jgi:hypothetical protein
MGSPDERQIELAIRADRDPGERRVPAGRNEVYFRFLLDCLAFDERRSL